MAEYNVVKGNRGGGKSHWHNIYEEFCKWSPEHAQNIIEYKPWGSTSILVRFKNGMAYKAKRYAANEFIMQTVSEDDIKRKYNIN